MYHRVRIKKLPNKALGGTKTGQQTADGALSIQPTAMGGADIDQYIGEKPTSVQKTLQPIARESANVEVEKGEIVAGDLNGDGMLETYVAGGKRHSQGGTPLNLPDDTFIFSDTAAMRIKDPNILAKFGKSTGSYTPADLAKQYDINKYRKILQDPDSDAIDRKTAELMIRNYTMKLGGLALAQEGMKGFPQGIPVISNPFLESNKISEEQVLPKFQPMLAKQGTETESPEENMGEPQEEVSYDESMPTQMPNGEPIAMSPEMMQEAPMGAYGMMMGGYNMPYAPDYAYGGDIPKALYGDEIDPYEQARTAAGNVTPTGKSNRFSATGESTEDYLARWKGIIPGIEDMTEGQAQAAIYDWTLENNPDEVKRMWKEYGITNEGKKYSDLVAMTDKGSFSDAILNDDEALKELKRAYVDGKFGARKLEPAETPETVAEEPVPQPQIVKDPATGQLVYTNKSTRPPLYNFPPAAPTPPRRTKAEWMTPDVVNLAGTFSDRARIKKYYPYAPYFNAEEPRPVFLNPDRELASNEEQVNVALQNLAQFTGPQLASSRASSLQGQGAKQSADILSRYNNANVGIANQFEMASKNMRNQANMYNNGLAKELYDKTVLTNQSYDNAIRQADQASRFAFQTGWKNASDLALVNAMSDQYDIDPKTGTVVFQGGKKITPEISTKLSERAAQLKAQGWKEDLAVRMAEKEVLGKSSPTGVDIDAILDNYQYTKNGGSIYVMGDTIFPFMFY
jgi:hypothetical protein